MKQLKKLFLGALCAPLLAIASSEPVHLDRAPTEKFRDAIAIQRGAQVFVNYCLNCHSKIDKAKATSWQFKLDAFLTHKIMGYVIFFGILLLIFQSIFDWSSVPMDYIDEWFANLATYAKNNLPSGEFTSLLSEGVIPGIGGIVIFVPQIVFLFLFISVLEESGYMSRVVFLMDKIMRPFGLSGKSIVPLISGTACAIPAIMGTRNIETWKERLITILVTPFITCSARLPVYAILIALIPNKFESLAAHDAMVELSGALKCAAVSLNENWK